VAQRSPENYPIALEISPLQIPSYGQEFSGRKDKYYLGNNGKAIKELSS